jgi:hypothetical protein
VLFEYAVEPKAIGSNWENCRFWMAQFGFDRGRLISQFPKNWFSMVYEASAHLKPVERARVEETLRRSKSTKVLRFGRQYDGNMGWIDNALNQQIRDPFHAIVAEENPQGLEFVLRAGDVDESHPLMIAPHNWEVPRVAANLAAAMAPLLRTAGRILLVDKYFKFDDQNCKETLREMLSISAAGRQSCVPFEIHFADHLRCPPIQEIQLRVGRWLQDVIPAGMSVVLFCWKERNGGEDFHDRFLLTDKGGMTIGAGFSASGPHQNAQIGLLDPVVWSAKLSALDRSSTVYELADRVLEVHDDGRVVRI